MPLPQPEDLADRIRTLELIVRDLKASITNQGGLTTASAGWIIPNQPFPPAPSSGGRLTASGDEPIWTEAGGAAYSLVPPPPPSPASAPTWPGSFSSPATISTDPTAEHYNLLRADVVNQLHGPLRSVILRGVAFGAWLDPSP
ncbi:hypothetical protein HD597_010101 [Nonomuraea thailandensis]|uniref:Uncharacterized protein n=1 Tax=Nonomuraea thailandensis TaxID=1188745 RepID=A0A9X2GPY7_9ACTN|nr:hypothetical protein [Nonomuraea thailandensis]MCP2363081.1 hypothetical protein [Nonomuraea thailandensis]